MRITFVAIFFACRIMLGDQLMFSIKSLEAHRFLYQTLCRHLLDEIYSLCVTHRTQSRINASHLLANWQHFILTHNDSE